MLHIFEILRAKAIQLNIKAVDLIILPQLTSKVKRFYHDQIRTFFFGFWNFGTLLKNADNSETV